jgi:hypothetical protein
MQERIVCKPIAFQGRYPTGIYDNGEADDGKFCMDLIRMPPPPSLRSLQLYAKAGQGSRTSA